MLHYLNISLSCNIRLFQQKVSTQSVNSCTSRSETIAVVSRAVCNSSVELAFLQTIYCFIMCYDSFAKADASVHSIPNDTFQKKAINPSQKQKGVC